jgi:hypothetical protein
VSDSKPLDTTVLAAAWAASGMAVGARPLDLLLAAIELQADIIDTISPTPAIYASYVETIRKSLAEYPRAHADRSTH